MNPTEIIAVADSVALRLAPVASEAWAMARQRVIAVTVMSLIGEAVGLAAGITAIRWAARRTKRPDYDKFNDSFPVEVAIIVGSIVAIICFICFMRDMTGILSLDYITAETMIDLVRPGRK